MDSTQQGSPQQLLQPTHQPHQQINHAFTLNHPAQPHQGLVHQHFPSIHQTYQSHGHQSHQGYQAQHQAHHPHQAQFHQGLKPLDPEFQDLSSQQFKHDYNAFSQPISSQPIPAIPDSQQTKSKSKKTINAVAKDSTESTWNILNGCLPKTLYNDVLDLDVQEKVGKWILSEEDIIHFQNLQNQMTKGVRLSATLIYMFNHTVCDCRGRKQPFQELTEGGVTNGVAAKFLKSKYNKLTEEEKGIYKPKLKLKIIIDQGKEEEATSRIAGVSSQSGNGDDQGIDDPAIPMHKTSCSFVEDPGVVINWLNNVNTAMHWLAVTYHLEGFVVLVATPGALRWHDVAGRVKPQDNCVTNLQLYILGHKVGLVLHDSLEKGTLKSWGYEVSLLANACSQIEWITCQKGSHALTNSQAQMIPKDLRMDLIRLSKLTNPSVSTDSAPLKQRLRTSSDRSKFF
ncbi:hypothetical protein DFH28DRAFT_1082349 [Melampsora americana]|nr:hypothetical protein DFH28DRAFT_1082349 [Melampsora americana]